MDAPTGQVLGDLWNLLVDHNWDILDHVESLGGRDEFSSLDHIVMGTLPEDPFFYLGEVCYQHFEIIKTYFADHGITPGDDLYKKTMILASELSHGMRVDGQFVPVNQYSGINLNLDRIAALTDVALEQVWATFVDKNPAFAENVFNSRAVVLKEYRISAGSSRELKEFASGLNHAGVIGNIPDDRKLWIIHEAITGRSNWNEVVYQYGVVHNDSMSMSSAGRMMNFHGRILYQMHPELHPQQANKIYASLPDSKKASIRGYRFKDQFYMDGEDIVLPLQIYSFHDEMRTIETMIGAYAVWRPDDRVEHSNLLIIGDNRNGKTMLYNWARDQARRHGVGLVNLAEILMNGDEEIHDKNLVPVLRRRINLLRTQEATANDRALILFADELDPTMRDLLTGKDGEKLVEAMKTLFNGQSSNSSGVGFLITGNIGFDELNPGFRDTGRSRVMNISPNDRTRTEIIDEYFEHHGIGVPPSQRIHVARDLVNGMNHEDLIALLQNYSQAEKPFLEFVVQELVGEPYLPSVAGTHWSLPYCAGVTVMASALGVGLHYGTVGGNKTNLNPKFGFITKTGDHVDMYLRNMCLLAGLMAVQMQAGTVLDQEKYDCISASVSEGLFTHYNGMDEQQKKFGKSLVAWGKQHEFIRHVLGINAHGVQLYSSLFAGGGNGRVLYNGELSQPCSLGISRWAGLYRDILSQSGELADNASWFAAKFGLDIPSQLIQEGISTAGSLLNAPHDFSQMLDILRQYHR